MHDADLLGGALYLKKILVNLYSNAIKYNKPGGSITTRLREVSRTADTAVYAFTIRDTGIGMTQDFIDNHLFEAFSRRTTPRAPSTAAPAGHVHREPAGAEDERHDHRREHGGGGSCFTVTMPFAIDHDPPAAGPEKEASADLHGKRLLVVEDNELNMEIVEFMLKSAGAEVVKAFDGESAVRAFAADPAGYDAILMDLMMPVNGRLRRGQGHPRQRADPCRDCAHHRHERQRLRRGREEMPGFRHERPHQQAAVQGCHAAHDCTVCINLPGTMP